MKIVQIQVVVSESTARMYALTDDGLLLVKPVGWKPGPWTQVETPDQQVVRQRMERELSSARDGDMGAGASVGLPEGAGASVAKP